MDATTHADASIQTVEEAQGGATKPRHSGIPEEWARKISGSRKAYWRLANIPQVNKALGLACWRNQGLLSLMDLYAQNFQDCMNRRMLNGTYGGVGGRGRDAPSYPIATAARRS
jgi:hypothetical protein